MSEALQCDRTSMSDSCLARGDEEEKERRESYLTWRFYHIVMPQTSNSILSQPHPVSNVIEPLCLIALSPFVDMHCTQGICLPCSLCRVCVSISLSSLSKPPAPASGFWPDQRPRSERMKKRSIFWPKARGGGGGFGERRKRDGFSDWVRLA
jgi:hypothetical protein